MVEAEEPLRARAIPDERVERREQRRAVARAPGGAQRGQRLRVRPGGRAPALDLHGDQAAVAHDRVDLLALQAVHVGQVGSHPDAQGAARRATSARRQLSSSGSSASSSARHGALGQVVHPPPALAAHADHLADVQQPLDRHLDVRPVPPLPAAPPAAELLRRQRALVAQHGEHLRAGVLGHLVPAPPRARKSRRRKANSGQDAIGSTQAACDQYSNARGGGRAQ